MPDKQVRSLQDYNPSELHTLQEAVEKKIAAEVDKRMLEAWNRLWWILYFEIQNRLP